MACSDAGGARCPAGATRLGDMCIVHGTPPPGSDAGPPAPLDASVPLPPPPPPPLDAGPADDAAPATDSAPADTAPTSVDGGPPPDAGPLPAGPCASEAACATWARALVDGVNRHRADVGGCATPLLWDERLASVAHDDAAAMAASDSLMGGLPDLLASVESTGLRPAQLSAFGGTTRVGPSDPLGRWVARSDVSARLADCTFDLAGAGFATNAAGDESYGRLLLAER